MNLIQLFSSKGKRQVAARTDSGFRQIKRTRSVLELAHAAIEAGQTLAQAVEQRGFGKEVDVAAAYAEGRLLAPVDAADPAHVHLTGTGLTHLGSAATRDAMHRKIDSAKEETLTDSMKMFRMGLENGKPARGKTGVQPEWFYKGNGSMLAGPGEPLLSPAFADDAGEEPEIAGIYIIGPDGTPFRLGFALANEFSDHVMERVNYLYLAHSKLRPCSIGPELLVGDLPSDIRGTSRIIRKKKTIWEKPFLSGEANMSHTIANLEHHHFKYSVFRQPGDVHVHMFGTATLSFADGMKAEDGDVFEIEAEAFGLPLRNPLKTEKPQRFSVKPL
ncbi:GguC family protein [Phyllobacterium sp. 0TCS1.6C]|uniref:AraD1 family protein n=1 Tax=unclassified Phyllobacterium TaxID=2638441 RepID=UPI00226509B9|nr:GguC family protein [Phyllobacterium sp. 0TCS1.6C]MCX8294122.1 GguC family protein [Phyllobacterium sp. 0TCS1.6A]